MGEVAKPKGDLIAARLRPQGTVSCEPVVQIVFEDGWSNYIQQDELRDLIVNRSVGKSTLATVLDMLKANASRDNIRRVIEAELGGE